MGHIFPPLRESPPVPAYPPAVQALVDRDPAAMDYDALQDAEHILAHLITPLRLALEMVRAESELRAARHRRSA